MYKLALFDDESIIRKNIIKKIKWEDYGFVVVGQGENGIEALEVIEETKPNVIFTDIEMPFINGLELAKIVYDKYPLIKIVLITGFDDFKYAQNAIDLDVFKYLLKPISSDQLTEILIKLKIELDKEKEEKENIELLRENYYENLPIIRENFFHELISTNLSKEEILQKADYLSLDLIGDYFTCAAIYIDKNLIDETKFKRTDYELIKYAVKNTANDIINMKGLGFVFFKNDYIVLMGVMKVKSLRRAEQDFTRTIELIKDSIQVYMKIKISIGVGKFTESIKELINSYESCINALNYRFILDSNEILYIEDLEPKEAINTQFDETKENNLINSLKFGNVEDVIDSIEDIFKYIKEIKLTFNEYQIYLFEIVISIIKVSRNLNIENIDFIGGNYNFFTEMNKFETSNELKDWFITNCIKLRNSINEGRQCACKIHVMNAKKYIMQNYHKESLSLNNICKHLHISPSYFGAIFKEETGYTCSAYILKIRMEKTKELISTTNLKNYEIAEKVGYVDQHYFSYTFKKYFKISPNEFKKSINNK